MTPLVGLFFSFLDVGNCLSAGDSHAQWEIKVFAEAMLDLIRPLVPWTIEAWD